MENKLLITEEILGSTISHFMIQNNLNKFSIFAKLTGKDTIDLDMIGGE